MFFCVFLCFFIGNFRLKYIITIFGDKDSFNRKGKVVAQMPVDERTRQPFGVLHGGASVALAETVGSTPSVSQ